MDLYYLFSSTLLTRFHSWAIRNSSLMLFSSIANNITGADEGFNGSATQLSWETYPGLAQLIFKLLTTKPHETDEPVTESRPKIEGDVQSVYAALDFLRHAGPPENYESRVLSQVMRNFDSKDWQLRETSARLFGALLHKRKEWFSTLEQLLNSNSTSTNESHSILLAVSFVLQYRLAVEVDRVSILGKQLFPAMIIPNHFIHICQIMLLTLCRRHKAPSTPAL
jgi:hypothetical protein